MRIALHLLLKKGGVKKTKIKKRKPVASWPILKNVHWTFSLQNVRSGSSVGHDEAKLVMMLTEASALECLEKSSVRFK